jgi:hypothetical protein
MTDQSAAFKEEFLSGFITCALWSSTDNADESGGEPLDKNYDRGDVAPQTMANLEADCRQFLNAAKLLLAAATSIRPYSAEQAGHDFWLSRNGHGAGFWDRGLSRVGDALHDLAKAYGPVDLTVGDDGKVW